MQIWWRIVGCKYRCFDDFGGPKFLNYFGGLNTSGLEVYLSLAGVGSAHLAKWERWGRAPLKPQQLNACKLHNNNISTF